MIGTLLATLVLPIQIHPFTMPDWLFPQAYIVQATIDSGRIIGLPRLKTMDKKLQKTIQINDLQDVTLYSVKPRKTLIKNYIVSKT